MIKAIQISNKRVGSTFLQNALNSHFDITAIDEVFVNQVVKNGMRKSGFVPHLKYKPTISAEDYIRNVIWSSADNVIFKLMYNQINHSNRDLENFIIDNDIPIIHIKRRNAVKRIISGHNAGIDNFSKIHKLNPDFLLNEVKKSDDLDKKWTKILKNQSKYLELYYEEIIGRNESFYTYVDSFISDKICDFFEVNRQFLFTTTKKKNKEDIWTYLPNKNGTLQKFRRTEFEWMVTK